MKQQEELLTLLQHGDTFFPSGSVSFSWGLEMLKDDSLVTSKEELLEFVENQIMHRWASFDRPILIHTYDCGGNIQKVREIDRLIDAMNIVLEIREGSVRLGEGFLNIYSKLDCKEAIEYKKLMIKKKVPGHIAVLQGLVWGAMGIDKGAALSLSAYTFCVAVLGAGLRLGLIGHFDTQNYLTKLRSLIVSVSDWPIPALEEISAFTPYAEIASMRHESSSARLFAN